MEVPVYLAFQDGCGSVKPYGYSLTLSSDITLDGVAEGFALYANVSIFMCSSALLLKSKLLRY